MFPGPLRIVVLMALRSHLLVAANFCAYEGEAVHEIKYAETLRDSSPKSSLTVVDRGYMSAVFFAWHREQDGSPLAHSLEKYHQLQGPRAIRAQ